MLKSAFLQQLFETHAPLTLGRAFPVSVTRPHSANQDTFHTTRDTQSSNHVRQEARAERALG
jgi:hypothetical protein